MRISLCALIGLAAISSPALADPVIDQAKASSPDGPIYAYDMSLNYDDVMLFATIDPSAEEGQRINVSSPKKSDWPDGLEDDLQRMDANADGDIWCKEFADAIPDDAVKAGETDTTVTFTFTPIPDEDADNIERKVTKKVKAEITLAKEDGAVLSYRANLPKPYKPMIVAKVNTLNMNVTCERAPDGRTYTQSFDFELAGSAMMNDFDEKMTRTITKLIAPVG
ncbi:MAG: hypothetical protein AAGH90_02590 [Pseudomonadota bacterium]